MLIAKRERFKVKRLLATFLLFFATALMALADGKLISVSFKNEKATVALRKVEKLSGKKIQYNYSDVNFTVTLTASNQTAEQVVDAIISHHGLKTDSKGDYIVIIKNTNAPKDEDVPTAVQGVVVDEKGEPIIGAQVKLLGSNIVTVTNINGAFSFDYYLQGEQKLQVSYVGMQTCVVPVKSRMNITMKEDSKILQDVVVTGIFKKAKESYTGAVSTIDKEQLNMYRGSNLLQTIKNIDASINFPINNAAGSNPNVLPNLNIRGSSSLPMSVEEFNTNSSQTVNTPLIILDGFEISLTKLMDYNDEQIESINILKDAAATAIYGSRGANGVIVVVTKTPKNGKLHVTAKAGLSLEIPDLSSYHLLNASQKLQLENSIGLYSSDTSVSSDLNLKNMYAMRLKSVAEGTDIDWLKKPLRNGVGQRYNIQLNGGSSEFRWGASLGYNGIAGAMKDSDRKTITGDVTLIYSIKNLTFRNYSSVASNHSNNSRYGSFQDYVDQQPYNNPYDENGNLVKTFPSFASLENRTTNPLYDASLNQIDKSEYFEFLNNFSVEWLILDGLRMRAQIGISTHRNTSDKYIPSEHSYFTTGTNKNLYSSTEGLLRRGLYTYGNGSTNLMRGNLTLSYTKTFKEKHQVYVGADYSISNQHVKSMQMMAEGFSNDDLSTLGNAMQYYYGGKPSSTDEVVRMVGLTGNANYTYDNRYYLDLSLRMDGSSKFGSDKRFTPFWSAGIGWNIHNEKFMKDQKLFNNLRLKASYGVTGSQDFSTESVYTTFSYDSANRYLGWSTASLMGLGNSQLTWQKTKEVNIGMEFGILKNRISGEVNWYNKTTSNLLSEMDLPLSTGFSSYQANVGELKNHGIEASLNAYIIRDYDRNINWTFGGQLVYNWNEISKLSDAILRQNELYREQGVDPTGYDSTNELSNLFYVGRPMNAIYAVRSAGIDPSTGTEVFYDKDGNVTYEWNALDKVYLGSSQPLWRGNFHTMLMYKNWTLNVSFGYHWGGKTYNSTLRNRVEVTKTTIQNQNVDERVLSSRWMKPGDVTFFKGFTNLPTHATSRYVFDDRVLELQSVSLQYRWNSQWLRRATKLESVIFSLNASDLFYWSTVKYERGTSYPYARNVQGTITLTL